MQIHIFIEPKFRPDKHHLCTGSRSNESSRRNLAEKPAYFAGCRLLSTTVLHAFLLKYVNFSLQNRQISGAEARYTSARARAKREAKNIALLSSRATRTTRRSALPSIRLKNAKKSSLFCRLCQYRAPANSRQPIKC